MCLWSFCQQTSEYTAAEESLELSSQIVCELKAFQLNLDVSLSNKTSETKSKD